MNTMVDNRQKYAEIKWVQGYLKLTEKVKQWSQRVRFMTDYEERRRAYINMTAEDEGRSRELVFIYDTPEHCKRAVEEHNEELGFREHYEVWVNI